MIAGEVRDIKDRNKKKKQKKSSMDFADPLGATGTDFPAPSAPSIDEEEPQVATVVSPDPPSRAGSSSSPTTPVAPPKLWSKSVQTRCRKWRLSLGEKQSSSSRAAFWSEHDRWREQVLQSPISVRVKEPKKEGGWGRSYVTYLITCDPMGYQVRRRYSDFVWLRDILTKRYVGILIAALPEKGGVGFNKSNFVPLRMRALGIFLEKVVKNPYLKSDTTVMDFLSITKQKEGTKRRRRRLLNRRIQIQRRAATWARQSGWRP